jgi:hypothetical protein
MMVAAEQIYYDQFEQILATVTMKKRWGNITVTECLPWMHFQPIVTPFDPIVSDDKPTEFIYNKA